MAKSEKKSPKKASNLFDNIMKASVSKPKNKSDQLDEIHAKIQVAIYDGNKQIEVELNSLEEPTLAYLKGNEYKVRNAAEKTIIYW